MSVDDDNKSLDPLTSLSHTLGYSNRCIQRILNNDPGAGANAAASALDMTFFATNALSELVWSPQRGLCLKCADRSFANRESSLLYGVAPFNMASGSASDKPIDKEIFMASLAAYDLGIEVAGENCSTGFPSSNAGIIPFSGTATSDKAEEMKNTAVMCFLRTEDPRNNNGRDELKLEVAQRYPTSEEPIAEAKYMKKETRASGMKIGVASEIHAVKESGANETNVDRAISVRRGHEKMSSLVDEDGKGKMVNRTPGVFLLENTESTAENDLKDLHGAIVCRSPDKIVAPESADDFENSAQLDDGLLDTDKALKVKQSSNSSKSQKDRIKGKHKVLADEDGNEEDDSHESVESCNSTGLFSTGKRQWDFERQLIVGSKRVKIQMHETPSSSSLVKHDSSFMNWISNMTKGFSKLGEGEAPSLSAALVNPDHRRENVNQDFVACNRNEDFWPRNVGFQSIFRSLYSQTRKVQDAVSLNPDRETERSEGLELDSKMIDMNATPVACHMVTGNVYKKFLPINERFNNSTSGNQVGPVVRSGDMSMNLANVQENYSSKTTENKNSSYLASNKENGTTSTSSYGKYKTNCSEKIDSEMLSERKTGHNFGLKGKPLESLWINRFTQKASGPLSNQDTSRKIIGEAQSQNLVGSLSEHENVEVGRKCDEEVRNRLTASETSFRFYKFKGRRDDMSSRKLILPSSRIKNSEAIASIFARKLDALKQIMPSDDPDNAAVTCLFCSIKGHHLRECPKITDTEIEDLLKNYNSHDGEKEEPCVCIRCFQLNHWAVGCPSACKRARHEGEQKVTATGALTSCYQNDSGIEKDLTFDWNSNEAATSEQMNLNAKLHGKEIASISGVKRFRENKMMPIYSCTNGHISDVPDGLFDAIRSLRLTRTDILKYMNCNLSLSNLDGFFLRLRLGKWEEGLGGTGYYAAYITGAQTENSQEKSKNSIAVNVGGVKCLVESQYISNHDFLEDELRAWWSATSRSKEKIPSEEELTLKIKDKQMLGF